MPQTQHSHKWAYSTLINVPVSGNADTSAESITSQLSRLYNTEQPAQKPTETKI